MMSDKEKPFTFSKGVLEFVTLLALMVSCWGWTLIAAAVLEVI